MRLALSLLVFLLVMLLSGAAQAQARGFQLNRYEPTPVGEWSFAVDHPWFTSTRTFAAGLTLNYAHDPLVYGLRAPNGDFTEQRVVINHQLLMHVDLAIALWDRLNISLTLPVTVTERGQAFAGVTPAESGALGDPRLGVMVRLWRQPDRDPISLSLGGYLWFPVNAADKQAGDTSARVLPKLVLGGLWRKLRWSLTGGFYYRPEAVIGNVTDTRGSTVGPSLQFGGLLHYADLVRRFAVGPELLLYTTVTGGHGFQKDYTNLELYFGGHYNIASQVQTGLALGLGALRDPGTPDFRLIFRLAYAPILKQQQPLPAPETRCPECRCPDCPKPEPIAPVVPAIPPQRECRQKEFRGTSLFDSGKWMVKAAGKRELAKMAEEIRGMGDQPGLQVIIEGHTDHEGASRATLARLPRGWDDTLREELPRLKQEWENVWGALIRGTKGVTEEDIELSILYNEWLSRMRAEAVVDVLAEKGVDRNLLRAVGYGLRRPLPPPATDRDAMQANRRVTFVFKGENCIVKPAQQQN